MRLGNVLISHADIGTPAQAPSQAHAVERQDLLRGIVTRGLPGKSTYAGSAAASSNG